MDSYYYRFDVSFTFTGYRLNSGGIWEIWHKWMQIKFSRDLLNMTQLVSWEVVDTLWVEAVYKLLAVLFKYSGDLKSDHSTRGQHCSFEAHWILVPEDHGSIPYGPEKNSSCVWVAISWLPLTLELKWFLTNWHQFCPDFKWLGFWISDPLNIQPIKNWPIINHSKCG